MGTSTSQLVTLTNVGGSDITISGVSINGTGYGDSGASGVTLNPTQSFALYVSFNPRLRGNVPGSLTISSNASNSVVTVALSATGVAVQHSVSLTWAPSTSLVIGYNVYRGPSADNIVKLNTSVAPSVSYTDQDVASGQTYFYAVTSVDSNNVESVFSNQVSATIP